VSKYDAAREEERARQNLRELEKARKATQADIDRAKLAKEAYDQAKKEK
jgi:hypothetical protein